MPIQVGIIITTNATFSECYGELSSVPSKRPSRKIYCNSENYDLGQYDPSDYTYEPKYDEGFEESGISNPGSSQSSALFVDGNGDVRPAPKNRRRMLLVTAGLLLELSLAPRRGLFFPMTSGFER
ncbi:hypothetical protein K3495_g4674 [Podosphaera aphanis]|nr:hypothetical protein K3495_g4674 [Podosphaera aphanis]